MRIKLCQQTMVQNSIVFEIWRFQKKIMIFFPIFQLEMYKCRRSRPQILKLIQPVYLFLFIHRIIVIFLLHTNPIQSREQCSTSHQHHTRSRIKDAYVISVMGYDMGTCYYTIPTAGPSQSPDQCSGFDAPSAANNKHPESWIMKMTLMTMIMNPNYYNKYIRCISEAFINNLYMVENCKFGTCTFIHACIFYHFSCGTVYTKHAFASWIFILLTEISAWLALQDDIILYYSPNWNSCMGVWTMCMHCVR